VQRLERQQTQLELDTLRNRKPVKTVQQDMLDVVMLLGADQYVIALRVQNGLQAIELVLWYHTNRVL